MVFINRQEVEGLLSMKDCIGIMKKTLESLSLGEAASPLRMAMRLPGGNVLGCMPAYLGPLQSVGAKIITVFPDNHGTGIDSHQGLVLLFDARNGSIQALVDGTPVTGIRTAAVSAVATDALAKADASDLAILGAGVQARAHLEAMMLVRRVRRVRVWSVYEEEAHTFAARESERLGIYVEPCTGVPETVEGADLICTVTAAQESVLKGEWLREGVHINAIGACLPKARELDTEAVVKARVYTDRRESLLEEAGDFLIPLEEGAIEVSHLVGEIGDVLTGGIPGRKTQDEITLFKALGLGVEDLAVARFVYGRARDEGIGQCISIGR